MLVLTRRVGEVIVIDERIHVTVVDLGGGRVRLAIAAPESVRVDRMEVFERREMEQRAERPTGKKARV